MPLDLSLKLVFLFGDVCYQFAVMGSVDMYTGIGYYDLYFVSNIEILACCYGVLFLLSSLQLQLQMWHWMRQLSLPASVWLHLPRAATEKVESAIT